MNRSMILRIREKILDIQKKGTTSLNMNYLTIGAKTKMNLTRN